MVIITYSGSKYDEPSLRLLVAKFPTATVMKTPKGKFYNINPNLNDTILCIGSENTNGTTEYVTNDESLGGLGYTNLKTPFGMPLGLIRTTFYGSSKIIILTSFITGNEEDEVEGLVTACYHLRETSIPQYVGDINVALNTYDLHLFELEPSDPKLLDIANKDTLFLKSYVQNEINKIEPDYHLIEYYVYGNKIVAISRVTGTAWWAFAIVSTAVVLSLGAVAFVIHEWNEPDVENAKAQQQMEITKQKTIEYSITTAQESASLIKSLPDGDQKVALAKQYIESTADTSKYLADMTTKYATFEEKGTLEQLKELLVTAAIIGGIGLGVYFLFKSGLFEAGTKKTRKSLEDKGYVKKSPNNVTINVKSTSQTKKKSNKRK